MTELICPLPDCYMPVKTRGRCHKHYKQGLIDGSIKKLVKPSETERFWAKVEISDGCWKWTATTHGGYGYFRSSLGTRLAHRVAWFLTGHPLPTKGEVLDHICFNRACVNPKHLRRSTLEDNAARHKPSCTCSACNPDNYVRKYCGKGHDKDSVGRSYSGDCSICRREYNRKWMKEYRASKRRT